MSDVCLYCQGSNLTETTVHDRRGMTPTTDVAWYQLASQQARYDTSHWCFLVPPHLTTDEVCHQPLMLFSTTSPHNRQGMTPTTDVAWYQVTSQQTRYATNHWCCLVPSDLTTDKMTPTTDVGTDVGTTDLTTDKVWHQPLMLLGTYWPHNRWGMTPTTDAAWYQVTSQQIKWHQPLMLFGTNWPYNRQGMTPTTDVDWYQLTLLIVTKMLDMCWIIAVGTHQGNDFTHNSSGNAQPQSSQPAEPLWTDPKLP